MLADRSSDLAPQTISMLKVESLGVATHILEGRKIIYNIKIKHDYPDSMVWC